MKSLIALVLSAAIALSPAVECGACGAVTAEWRYDLGYDGSLVPVCVECWETAYGTEGAR